MSQSNAATSTPFERALAVALAEHLACDAEKVDVQVSAPGLDGLAGRVRLELDLESPAPSDVDDAEDEPEPEAEVSDQVPAAISRDDEDEATALSPEDLDAEADAAADFLEGLLDALDLPGDLRIRLHDDHAELEVVEIGSGALIGRRGQTLEAIQELVRCALQRQFQRRSRVKIDAEGYRSRRLEKLIEKAEESIEAVLDTGEPERLEPMDVFERKAVHQLVAEVEGLTSRSQGREPARRVVIERE